MMIQKYFSLDDTGDVYIATLDTVLQDCYIFVADTSVQYFGLGVTNIISIFCGILFTITNFDVILYYWEIK